MVQWYAGLRWDVGIFIGKSCIIYFHRSAFARGWRLSIGSNFGCPEDRTEGEWLQHSYIDLSQWAGEDVVYLAWRWQGVEADDWYLDDVEVVPLAPDL